MREAIVRTADRQAVLYKYGVKNRTVALHALSNPMDLASKRADGVDEYSTAATSEELPMAFGDIAAGVLVPLT